MLSECFADDPVSDSDVGIESSAVDSDTTIVHSSVAKEVVREEIGSSSDESMYRTPMKKPGSASDDFAEADVPAMDMVEASKANVHTREGPDDSEVRGAKPIGGPFSEAVGEWEREELPNVAEHRAAIKKLKPTPNGKTKPPARKKDTQPKKKDPKKKVAVEPNLCEDDFDWDISEESRIELRDMMVDSIFALDEKDHICLGNGCDDMVIHHKFKRRWSSYFFQIFCDNEVIGHVSFKHFKLRSKVMTTVLEDLYKVGFDKVTLSEAKRNLLKSMSF